MAKFYWLGASHINFSYGLVTCHIPRHDSEMDRDVNMPLLDDIWAEPLAEEPIPVSEQRKRGPLFLPGDSDEEISSFQDLQAPNTESTEVDETLHPDKGKLDAIFADIDNENEDIFADVDKPIDLEAMQHRAKAKIAAMQPESTAMAVDGSQATSKKDGPVQRRPVAKLDEEKLLGPDGFPRLLKDYKTFKVLGKGREVCCISVVLLIHQSDFFSAPPRYRTWKGFFVYTTVGPIGYFLNIGFKIPLKG